MRNIALTMEYDGTHFAGWQIQKNDRTVQGEIEKVLSTICRDKIKVVGSGRTDSGVHALGQVAHFKTACSMSLSDFLKALNALLPKDVSILKVREVQSRFHAQYNVKSKTYRYAILNRPVRSALNRQYSYYVPFRLNLPLMRREAQLLKGRHDFKSFQARDPADKDRHKEKHTIRTLKKISIRKKGDFVFIDVEGDGFLYKMARNIVGTLIKIGSGLIPAGGLLKILTGKHRPLAGPTAPPYGLYLVKVKY